MRKRLLSAITVMAVAALAAGCATAPKADTTVSGAYTNENSLYMRSDATGTTLFRPMFSKGSAVEGVDWGW